MAETVTSVVDLIKPEIGGSFDTWGNRWNDNADKLDSWMSNSNKMLSTSIQNGGNVTGTFTDYDANGNAISPARNLSDESFRTMQNLLFYAANLNDDPMNDIPANRPGALVTQRWVRTLIDLIFPIGTILAWAGTTETIPYGWCMCDGNRPGASPITPPNLMGRCIVGSAYTGSPVGYRPGDTYGTAWQFGHYHTVNIDGTSLNYSQLPPHVHDSTAPGSELFIARMTSGGSYLIQGGGPANGYGQGSVGDGALLNNGTTPYLQGLPHNHVGHVVNDNAPPPYYLMLYIMKYLNWKDMT